MIIIVVTLFFSVGLSLLVAIPLVESVQLGVAVLATVEVARRLAFAPAPRGRVWRPAFRR
uniref:hypothetical protein n=1 Tax=Streptomyces cellulosae TaxID=1968 RepID=UPI002ED5B141